MRILALVFGIVAAPVTAHEFWIEPLEYQIGADVNLRGNIVNGEGFDGTQLPYVPQRFAYFLNYAGQQRQDVVGRVGDLPAMDVAPVAQGLNTVIYQAGFSTVDYESWEKFQRFVDHKDLGDVRSLHEARGLPTAGFKEIYTRYAKTLIAVGHGEGSDSRIGMETEIIALTNPYTDDMSQGMSVQVIYKRAPRADEQVEVFEKSAATGEVAITTYRTNAQGVATFPVRSGHSYMVDAVVLREPGIELAERSGAVWETLWANLTFAVP